MVKRKKVVPVGFAGHVIPQRMEELEKLLSVLPLDRPCRYLEIGLRHGSTFHWIGERLPKGSTMVGVDWPGALWGDKKLDGEKVLGSVAVNLESKGLTVRIFLGDSKSEQVVSDVSRYKPFDLIFIDGDHTYNGVLADWSNYNNFGSVIAFHDIDVQYNAAYYKKKNLKNYGIPKLWKYLKTVYKYKEFIDLQNRGMGIGVVWKG